MGSGRLEWLTEDVGHRREEAKAAREQARVAAREVKERVISTFAVLFANLGICISEFVGIGAALSLAHVPVQISVPVAAAAIWLLVVRG